MTNDKKWFCLTIALLGIWCFPIGVYGEEIQPYRVAGIVSTKSNYWQELYSGIEEGCRELGLSFFNFDISLEDSDSLTWTADEAWKLALMSDVDAIIADGNLPDEEMVKAARERGVVVVLVDSDAKTELRDAYVGTDNEQAGKLAVQVLNEQYGITDGSVMLQTHTDLQAVSQRGAAIGEALRQECPEIKIVQLQIQGYTDIVFNSSLEETIANCDNLQAIFSLMESETAPYVQALKRLNVDDHVRLIAFDLSDDLLEYLREGVIDALIVQQSYEIGYKSARIVDELLRGEKLEEDTVYIECLILDQSNLSLYDTKEEMQ